METKKIIILVIIVIAIAIGSIVAVEMAGNTMNNKNNMNNVNNENNENNTSNNNNNTNTNTNNITHNQNNTYKVGDIITIKLNGNPTTGYEWTTKPGSNVELISSNFVTESSSQTGSGGTYIFKFKAKSTGTDVTTFHYRQSFDVNSGEEIKHIKITVV
ncbi:MAG: protease inhibitor I42 family protein [Methanobacteriaceae archaeon]